MFILFYLHKNTVKTNKKSNSMEQMYFNVNSNIPQNSVYRSIYKNSKYCDLVSCMFATQNVR